MITLLPRPKELARFLYHQRIRGFAVPLEIDFGEGATDAFREQLARSRCYLEFGSGASTLLAGRVGVPTVVVESDRFFARSVRGELAADADVRFVEPNVGFTVEWGRPFRTKPTPERVERWSRYVNAPYSLLDAFPDFILVDGRFRLACLLEAARRARLGGHEVTIMCDDYVDRTQYHVAERYIGEPRMAGRAAFFDVGPARPGIEIGPSVVHAAVADWS